MPICLQKLILTLESSSAKAAKEHGFFRRSVVLLQFWVGFLLPAVSQTENCLLVTHTESYMGICSMETEQ